MDNLCLCFSSLTSIPNILSILFMSLLQLLWLFLALEMKRVLLVISAFYSKAGMKEIFVPPPAESKDKLTTTKPSPCISFLLTQMVKNHFLLLLFPIILSTIKITRQIEISRTEIGLDARSPNEVNFS